MKRIALPLLIAAVSFPTSPAAQAPTPLPRYWVETKAETLWRTRYTNCDYGFYVLLAAGVVAHGTLPPSPNHGFLIALSNVGQISPVSANGDRIIWVDASYDTSDDQSLTGAISEWEHNSTEVTGPSGTDERTPTTLAGLKAIKSTVEYQPPKGGVIEEAVVAARSGIIYTIALNTTPRYRSVDEAQFRKILNGFRLLKLPSGECTNG